MLRTGNKGFAVGIRIFPHSQAEPDGRISCIRLLRGFVFRGLKPDVGGSVCGPAKAVPFYKSPRCRTLFISSEAVPFYKTPLRRTFSAGSKVVPWRFVN